MGNKLRHEGDEVRIKVIWPDRGYWGPARGKRRLLDVMY